MNCHFDIEIHAPRGLAGIETTIGDCELPLYAWKSGYNGKIILRASQDDDLEWGMDSSDEDSMFASGYILASVELAESRLRSLSRCLVAAGFRHSILLDGPDGNLYAQIEHV